MYTWIYEYINIYACVIRSICQEILWFDFCQSRNGMRCGQDWDHTITHRRTMWTHCMWGRSLWQFSRQVSVELSHFQISTFFYLCLGSGPLFCTLQWTHMYELYGLLWRRLASPDYLTIFVESTWHSKDIDLMKLSNLCCLKFKSVSMLTLFQQFAWWIACPAISTLFSIIFSQKNPWIECVLLYFFILQDSL